MRSFQSTSEVADLLGVSNRTVLNLIGRGELKAVKVGRQWRIAGECLQVFLGNGTAHVESKATGSHAPHHGAELSLVANTGLRIDLGKLLALVQPNGAKHHEASPAAPASTASESQATSALTEADLNILEVLARQPHRTVHQIDIAAAAGYSKHATRESLERLRALGFVHRPHGERRGEAATARGRQFLEEVTGAAQVTG